MTIILKRFHNHYQISKFFFIMLICIIFTQISFPGDLEPEEGPESTAIFTLEDLYNRLDTGEEGEEQEGFTEPAVGPIEATMVSINEIMAIAPSLDSNGAKPEDVLAGKVFWGLTSGQWGYLTGTRAESPIPETGQTISYRVGDDGHYQMGFEWPDPRFTDNDDGTVTDNLTGLMWTKNAHHGVMTWYDAIDHCNNLEHPDYDDWRLPNVRELQSLIDYGSVGPALPEDHPFIHVQEGFYWSSTTGAGNIDTAWHVRLHSGSIVGGEKSSEVYVLPVRGGN